MTLSHIFAGKVKPSKDPEEVKEGIREGFLDIDQHMHKLARQDNWDRSGSTAASVLISSRHIYFINCGDSRTVLCHDGQVVFYTEDHKPFNPRERERIQNAGGSVTLQRVNGSLAVSRALGDFDFKEVDWRPQTEQLVSPEPEVYELERTPEDEFLILACDGVWDAVGNEELCAFVRSRMLVCNDLRDICTQVIDLCLYKVSRCLGILSQHWRTRSSLFQRVEQIQERLCFDSWDGCGCRWASLMVCCGNRLEREPG